MLILSSEDYSYLKDIQLNEVIDNLDRIDARIIEENGR